MGRRGYSDQRQTIYNFPIHPNRIASPQTPTAVSKEGSLTVTGAIHYTATQHRRQQWVS